MREYGGALLVGWTVIGVLAFLSVGYWLFELWLATTPVPFGLGVAWVLVMVGLFFGWLWGLIRLAERVAW